jgi:hypothetical protein
MHNRDVRRFGILEMIENSATNRIAGISITGAGRLCDAEGFMWDGRTEGASESGDAMRFLLRFVGERIGGDPKRSVAEELLGIELSVRDGENLPEWEEDAVVDPNEGLSGPELTLAMEDCIDNLDRLLARADDDELANEFPVFFSGTSSLGS